VDSRRLAAVAVLQSSRQRGPNAERVYAQRQARRTRVSRIPWFPGLRQLRMVLVIAVEFSGTAGLYQTEIKNAAGLYQTEIKNAARTLRLIFR